MIDLIFVCIYMCVYKMCVYIVFYNEHVYSEEKGKKNTKET